MGRPYRYGDARGSPAANGGGGSLESSVHATVHFWTGTDPPSMDDMGQLAHSARDPVFFAHHSNIDRMWQVRSRINIYDGTVLVLEMISEAILDFYNL
ncbi:unnamed protein product [Calypogeia fissa]